MDAKTTSQCVEMIPKISTASPKQTGFFHSYITSLIETVTLIDTKTRIDMCKGKMSDFNFTNISEMYFSTLPCFCRIFQRSSDRKCSCSKENNSG